MEDRTFYKMPDDLRVAHDFLSNEPQGFKVF
jgi:hypothetical protein